MDAQEIWFDHEKLDVYREAVAVAVRACEEPNPGRQPRTAGVR